MKLSLIRCRLDILAYNNAVIFTGIVIKLGLVVAESHTQHVLWHKQGGG